MTYGLESSIHNLLLREKLGEHVEKSEAVHLLEDVQYAMENIQTCAAAALQWPGDSDRDQEIRAAGVLVATALGMELRESEMEPS